MDYIKHFNEQSKDYLLFRPNYPSALYDYLFTLVKTAHCAWDCGTGNGQVAVALAKRFAQVIATDINQTQIDVAPKPKNIRYICCPAENTPIAANSVELITIAQALHWFDFDFFYQEVRRVSKSSGVIAAWCYDLGKFTRTAIDNMIAKLFKDILGDEYWPSERRYVDEKYLTIPFPFAKIAAPPFIAEKNMNFSQLIGYLNTWSAVKEYQLRNRINPIDLIINELESAWGTPQQIYTMHWSLHLLVGFV
jgi:SAM-dependent methyltransferase